jgi:hypothetical protein
MARFWRHSPSPVIGEVKACRFSALHLPVGHPLFDRSSVKADFGTDLEGGNLMIANQSVECDQMNL